jgi:hypothetical protein
VNAGKIAKKGQPTAAKFTGLHQVLPLLSHLAATGGLPDYVRSALPHLKRARDDSHFAKMVALFAKQLARKQQPLLANSIGVLHFIDGANTSIGGIFNYCVLAAPWT